MDCSGPWARGPGRWTLNPGTAACSRRPIPLRLPRSAGWQTFQLDKLKLEIDGPKPQTAGLGSRPDRSGVKGVDKGRVRVRQPGRNAKCHGNEGSFPQTHTQKRELT